MVYRLLYMYVPYIYIYRLYYICERLLAAFAMDRQVVGCCGEKLKTLALSSDQDQSVHFFSSQKHKPWNLQCLPSGNLT